MGATFRHEWKRTHSSRDRRRGSGGNAHVPCARGKWMARARACAQPQEGRGAPHRPAGGVRCRRSARHRCDRRCRARHGGHRPSRRDRHRAPWAALRNSEHRCHRSTHRRSAGSRGHAFRADVPKRRIERVAASFFAEQRARGRCGARERSRLDVTSTVSDRRCRR